MLVKLHARPTLFLSLVAFFCLLFCIAPLVRHHLQHKTQVEETFKSRHELVTKFVALQRDRITVMANLLADDYHSPNLPPPPASTLVPHAQPGVWQLQPEWPVAGVLTGMTAQPLSTAVEREMRAALRIDTQVGPALQYDPDIAWIYYLSAQQFIYIAPIPSAAPFYFSPQLYERGYWLEGGPEQNPARRMILKGPYEDLAGKGWIMTFAQPVYRGDQFMGMIALDMNVSTLEKLTNVGAAVGESMLISEHDRLIAKQSGFEAGVFVRPPLSLQLLEWDKGEEGDLWLSSPVVDNELWLVHRVKRSELLWASVRDSIGVWFVVMLFAALVVVSRSLYLSLAEVTRLTRVDPLTQALNRRGFYEAAGPLLAAAQRKSLPLAVLMMDIDHFKKVNDTYGHAEGDAVLKQLGSHLLKARRPSDVFCRWGGEEFIILLPLDKAEDALAVAERMRAKGQRTHISSDNSPVTLSGGLVLLQPDESLDQAIKRADELLYRAKQSGRNRIAQG